MMSGRFPAKRGVYYCLVGVLLALSLYALLRDTSPKPKARPEKLAGGNLPAFMQEVCALRADAKAAFGLSAKAELSLAPEALLQKSAEPKFQTVKREMQGTLSLKRKGKVSVEGRLSQKSGVSRFGFELDSRCRISSFSFPLKMPREEQTALVGVLQELQFIIPPSSSLSEWESHEQDALGKQVSRYRVIKSDAAGCGLQKTKLRYETLAQAGGNPYLRAEVKASNAAAWYEKGAFWLKRASKQENVELLNGAAVFAKASVDIQLDSLSGNFPWPEADETSALAAYVDFQLGERVLKQERPKTAEELDAQFAQTDWQAALQSYARILKADEAGAKTKAVELLADYLRYQPERALDLAAAIRAGRVEEGHQALAFLAMQLAGTAQCESALIGVLGDSQFDAMNRMRAAIALQDLPAPGKAAVDALYGQMNGLKSEDQAGLQVAKTAALSLGSLANNLRNSDPLLAQEAEEKLVEKLNQEKDPQNVSVLLSSLGNTHNPAFEATAAKYLKEPSEGVRAAAAETLGKIESSNRESLLMQQLGEETSARVKREIYTALAQVPEASLAAVQSVAERLPDEPRADVRREMIKFIGPHARNDEKVRQALVSAFAGETDDGMLRLIGGFLAP